MTWKRILKYKKLSRQRSQGEQHELRPCGRKELDQLETQAMCLSTNSKVGNRELRQEGNRSHYTVPPTDLAKNVGLYPKSMKRE